MPHADFVHLRVHTAFSLSEGAIKIDDLAELCRAHAMPAVAITDSGNLFGAMQFSDACCKAGVQPIIGCVLPLARDDDDKRLNRRPASDQLVLLAQNEAGYANLVRLVSHAFLDGEPGDEPRVSWNDLERRADGLIAFSGGPAGPVGRLLAENQASAAEAALERLKALFPGRLYVELMRHGLEIENRIEPALVDLAYAHDLPLVATNDVFFADADMFGAQDALLCIAAGATLGRDDRRRLTPDHRFKSPAEMRAVFADLPEAVDNTLVVAQRCAVRAPRRAPILPAFPVTEGRNEAEELKVQARAGLDHRLEAQVFTSGMNEAEREAAAAPYRERLEYELGVIIEMNYAGYFLIVAEFIQWAKSRSIPVGPGRGSGAGSVVSWALTITDLDPLRFGLLFERFLNPERVSMPDFDIDFCEERRDEVIRHVQEKYGHDQVAQIITFGTLRARAALRDVGRVLEMPYGKVDRICKLVPNNPARPASLADALAGEPQLKAERDNDEGVARLIDVALKLEGLYRHASTHAAGVVIGDRPLDELVPLYRDPRSDMAVTQFSMKDVESAGLVKFDFLGLKTLTVLDRARRLLEARGVTLDLGSLPLDDGLTYEMLSAGDTVGVFQFEGSGMRDLLREAVPTNIEDLIALVALYRPGPMENIPKYIACKHGRERPEFLHEMVDPVVKDTYGIIVYQEQVMEIARVLSGYSLGKADLLRRAMGKKNKAEMEAQREAFVAGAVARGVPKGRAAHIFELVAKFADYGFNKSHAAAYALVAYQTAYIKANYPVEFFAASMTLDLGNTDKINTFRQELDRLGIPLLPPDVNRSGAEFTVEHDGNGRGAIRYALAAVKNVGAQAMRTLVEARSRGGPFRNLFDFAERLDPRVINKRQLENLARAGAFDSLEPNRHCVFEAVEMLVRYANAAVLERASSQETLFGQGSPAKTTAALALPEVDPWPAMTRLREECAAIGFYLSAHPLEAYGALLERLEVTAIGDLAEQVARAGAMTVNLAGVVVGKRERRSSRGSRFAFVQLSDPSGIVEIAFFSETLATDRELLESGMPLHVSADARIEGEALRLTARAVQALDQVAREATSEFTVRLCESTALHRLSEILGGAGEGRGRVKLLVEIEDREVEVVLPGRVALSPAICLDLRALPGVRGVHEA
ncbi:MAG: DNA polymerase III subunit alpha [Alphaproteobacteria bacterium]